MEKLGPGVCLHWVQYCCRSVAVLSDQGEKGQWEDYGGEVQAASIPVQARCEGKEERDGKVDHGNCGAVSEMIHLWESRL